jgi:hypothetical protein
MQLRTSFALLLASFLFAFLQSGVDAAPIRFKRSTSPSASMTLPLRRVLHTRENEHPLVEFQQRVNRAYRRWARMTGRALPSDEELVERLRKRILSVEGKEGLVKRFSRFGVPSRLKNKRVQSDQLDAANGDVLSDVTSSNTPATPNSLALDIEGQDISYLANITVGTPPRGFLILVDSGSSDFWIGSETCASTAGGGCGNHNFLGPNTSSTFNNTGQSFQVTYGTGSVSGTIVTDNVVIGNFSLPAHTFGVANNESVQFSSNAVPLDGLMGLAQSSLSQQKVLTPIESMQQAGLMEKAIVGYRIPRLADNLNDGEITFGALDTTKFDPQTLVTVNSVSQTGFWEAPMDAVTVNGQNAQLLGRTVIMDTGTTLLIVPPADAIAIHTLIPGAQPDGQGGFTIPCTGNATVALTFAGISFSIDPRDIAVQPVDPSNPQGTCISGIVSGTVGGATEWLAGDVFLKNVYFGTDATDKTLSLAQLVGST